MKEQLHEEMYRHTHQDIVQMKGNTTSCPIHATVHVKYVLVGVSRWCVSDRFCTSSYLDTVQTQEVGVYELILNETYRATTQITPAWTLTLGLFGH